MIYDEDTEIWTVSGTNQNTSQSSILRISKQALGGYEFDWAMVVSETIKKDGDCKALPADPNGIVFTNVTVNDQKIEWIKREKLNDCDQLVQVNGLGQIKMTWSY